MTCGPKGRPSRLCMDTRHLKCVIIAVVLLIFSAEKMKKSFHMERDLFYAHQSASLRSFSAKRSLYLNMHVFRNRFTQVKCLHTCRQYMFGIHMFIVTGMLILQRCGMHLRYCTLTLCCCSARSKGNAFPSDMRSMGPNLRGSRSFKLYDLYTFGPTALR